MNITFHPARGAGASTSSGSTSNGNTLTQDKVIRREFPSVRRTVHDLSTRWAWLRTPRRASIRWCLLSVRNFEVTAG